MKGHFPGPSWWALGQPQPMYDWPPRWNLWIYHPNGADSLVWMVSNQDGRRRLIGWRL